MDDHNSQRNNLPSSTLVDEQENNDNADDPPLRLKSYSRSVSANLILNYHFFAIYFSSISDDLKVSGTWASLFGNLLMKA